MLPPELQFQLLPRRQRWWVKGLTLVFGIGTWMVLALMAWQGQTSLEQEREALRQLRDSTRFADSLAIPAPPDGPPSISATGRMRRAAADLRLLEIERCVQGAMNATAINLVETMEDTVDLQLDDPLSISELTACMNTGIQGGRWQWVSLVAEASTQPSTPARYRAVLRYESKPS